MGKCLPFSRWPASDQEMWQGLTRQGGVFDDHGALVDIRPTTRKIYHDSYGRWLHWLLESDPAAIAEQPVARASLPRLKAWLDSSPDLSATSRYMYFNAALRVLRAAEPNYDWSRHLRAKQGLGQVAGRGNPSRKQGRILSSKLLLEAGLRLAGLEADAATTPLGRAKAQRDGAMLALLSMMPIRHRAFTALRVGQSLLVEGDRLTIALSEELTKTGTFWEAQVPEPAATTLRTYLLHGRPFLLSRAEDKHDCLWLSDNGSPMSYSYIGTKIPDLTGRLTGVRIPPHFFRDAAATTLARESREAALVIAPVLGQANSRTAERHYIQAGSVEVGRDFAKLLRRMKEAT